MAAAAVVCDLELAPAAPADRDPLQQRAAFADRAAGLVRARARVRRRSARGCPRTWPCRCSRGGAPRSTRPILLGGGDASAGACSRARRRSARGGSSRTRTRRRRPGCRARCGSGGRSGPPTDLAVREAAHRELAAARGASTATPGGPTRARRTGRRSLRSRRAPLRPGSSRISPSSSPHTSPTGSALRSSPRSALLRIPPCSRARSTCNSASDIVPFSPSSSRSLNAPG